MSYAGGMKLDTMLDARGLAQAADDARAAEEMGFDGLWSVEAQHDPFLPLAVAAPATRRLSLGTAIALAFPRSPMILAYTAWDLQKYSGGRFILGLGTQVKGHNERRFSVKWESPGKRLREVILALRAIWDCWQNGTKLDFQGEFYQHTLMTPFFSPGPIEHPHVPIFIAGVNPYVARLAGELADGFHVHPFHSPKFLRERLIPDIETGAAKAGRTRAALELSTQAFLAIGESRAEIAEIRERIRQQISFYASTRAYQPVLDVHGWSEVSQRLGRLAAHGDWQKMPAEISDEMIDAFSLAGTPDEIAEKLSQRYDGLLDRVSPYFPPATAQDRQRWRAIVGSFHR
jgi:probable F420-dependent oxidoreductase